MFRWRFATVCGARFGKSWSSIGAQSSAMQRCSVCVGRRGGRALSRVQVLSVLFPSRFSALLSVSVGCWTCFSACFQVFSGRQRRGGGEAPVPSGRHGALMWVLTHSDRMDFSIRASPAVGWVQMSPATGCVQWRACGAACGAFYARALADTRDTCTPARSAFSACYRVFSFCGGRGGPVS